MAHADHIAPEFLQKVAGELKGALEGHLPTIAGNENENFALPPGQGLESMEQPSLQVELCETFAVWKLKPWVTQALRDDKFPRDIFDCAEPTNFLYHQVRHQGNLVAFARSRVGDASRPGLSQYHVSPLMSSVDRAIDVIEESESHDSVAAGDPLVRFLEIPSYHTTALWLYAEALKESRSVIVKAPRNVARDNLHRLLTSAEFFGILKETGVIQAVVSDRK